MFTFEPLTDMLAFDGLSSKQHKPQVSLFPLLLLDHKEWPASVPPHTEGVRALFASRAHPPVHLRA